VIEPSALPTWPELIAGILLAVASYFGGLRRGQNGAGSRHRPEGRPDPSDPREDRS